MQNAPGSLTSFLRTTVYTDFYIACDIVDWSPDIDQALVLAARATDYLGIAATKEYVMNWDVRQDSDGTGDRFGGQLQINRIDSVAPLAAVTIGVAEISLERGRSYRFVFKGVGADLTAQVYDSYDLTSPLITLVASDGTYPSGACSITVFDRGGRNPSDGTFDNFYLGPSDPNTIAPALAHPIAGTPQVVMRNPTNRFTNFHPIANGIGFTASTFTTDNINVSATKLYLNNVDVSASLSTPANAPTASFTTPTSPLAANTIYSARIEVESATGLKGTNTFWFDTFTDAYLATAPVKTVEVEDYNHTSGLYQLDPISVSGFDTNGLQVNGNGVGYLDQGGLDGVDFDDNRTTVEGGFNQYRIGDFVGTVQGSFEISDLLHTGQPTFYDDGSINRGNDNTRQKYAVLGMREYQVVRTEAGEWLNYTRVFLNTNYNVFIRVGSFGSTSVNLDLVTSDPTVTGQTTAPLGTFTMPNQLMRSNYRYQPLMSNGVPAVVNLAGTNTIRLTMAGTPVFDNRLINLNYLLFVPVPATTTPSVALQSSATVNGQYNDDLSAVVNTGNKTITVPVSGDARFYRIRSGSATTITSITRVGANVVITYN